MPVVLKVVVGAFKGVSCDGELQEFIMVVLVEVIAQVVLRQLWNDGYCAVAESATTDHR